MDEVQKRKDRLKRLREEYESRKAQQQTNRPQNEEEALPRPVFRNYLPHDESLKAQDDAKAKPVDLTEQVQEQLESSRPANLVEELNLQTLAPRKCDWDLKRDVAKKLAKLERRTQKAIAEIIRDRLKASPEQLGEVGFAAKPDADTNAKA